MKELVFGIVGILAIAGILFYRYKTDPDFLDKVRNRSSSTKSPSTPNESGFIGVALGFILGGGFVGALIGFLLRPSAPLIGQLPLETVITQGRNLRGLDSLLVQTAQTSFSYLLSGAIIGGIVGIAAAIAFNKNRRISIAESTRSNLQSQPKPVIPKQVELNQLPEEVISVLGQPQKIINLGAKVIYDYNI